jgi:exodeoxyribonuclease VII large subunit
LAQRRPFDPNRVRFQPPQDSAGLLPLEPASLTPRQVNAMIGGAVARHLPPTLHVLGEIGDFSRAGSGHFYFSLKDQESELRCVMWRSDAQRLKFTVETGMQVIATGGIEVYVPRGTYQLMVRRLEPRGAGALEVAFRQLRERLQREGLLDPRRKRPLPLLPRRIAVLTSEHGAALRDILQTIARRCPCIEVHVIPVPVQGAAAAPAIARALRRLSESAAELEIEVAIVGRGGGSLEDLWAFNEEIVARAVVACSVPVVSAVGHEVDVSISDLVADVRAATPTAAAELVAPQRLELLALLERQAARAQRAFRHALELERSRITRILSHAWLKRPIDLLRLKGQTIDENVRRAHLLIGRHETSLRARLRDAEMRLLQFGCGVDFVRQEHRLTQRVGALRIAFTRRVTLLERELQRRVAALRRAAAESPRAQAAERIRQVEARLTNMMFASIRHARELLDARLEALSACDPKRVLQRGYSITRDARTRKVIRSVDQVRDGTRLATEVANGEFRSTVENPSQPSLFDT